MRYQRTITNSNTSGSNSGVYQPVREHLLMPGEFGGELRVTPQGPRALLLAPGANAVLQWNFPQLQSYRKARVDAAWTLPGFTRPVWGAVPPRTGTPTQGAESAAASVAQASVTTQIIEQQPESTPTPVAPTSDPGGLTDMAADHVVSASLDAALPGAGALFDLMSMAEPEGQATPAPATRQQQQTPVEHEEEDEAGQ